MHYLFYAAIAISLWASLATLAAGLSHVPPFLLLAVTLLLGGSLSIKYRRHWQLSPSILAFGTTGILGYHLLLFMALRLAEPVEANLINYLWPLLIVVLSPAFLPGLKLTWQHLLGALSGFSGVYLLIAGPEAITFSGQSQLGYLLALAAAFTWASYSLISTRLAGVHSATVGLFCLLSGALSLIISLIFELNEIRTAISLSDCLMLVLLGLGPMGLSFYAWDKALKIGDPRTIGVLSYFTPLLSTLLLIWVTGRAFEVHVIASLALIVGGSVITQIRGKI